MNIGSFVFNQKMDNILTLLQLRHEKFFKACQEGDGTDSLGEEKILMQ
jgi:hypothetical protein